MHVDCQAFPEDPECVTPPPEPEPVVQVVKLDTDQMAVFLLGICIVGLCLPAGLVLAFGSRG